MPEAYKQQCERGALYNFGAQRIFAVSDDGPWLSATSDWNGHSPNSTEEKRFPLKGHFGRIWDKYSLEELIGVGVDRSRAVNARLERRGDTWFVLRGKGQKVLLSFHVRDRIDVEKDPPVGPEQPLPEGDPNMEGGDDPIVTPNNIKAVIGDIVAALLPAILAKAERNLLTHTLPSMLRPPDWITLPSGMRRDMSFCIGMTERRDDDLIPTLWVRWAFGYRIGFDPYTNEWTVAGTEFEVFTGEDAEQLKAWWDADSTKLPLQPL